MRQLLWKEWHEQRWKLGFGSIVLCAFVLIGHHTRVVADEAIVIGVCVIGVLMLPVLTAAGLVSAERDRGTLKSLLALPVERWKMVGAKWLIAAALCAGPLLAAAGISLVTTLGRELSAGTTLAIYLRSAISALLLMIWIASLTTRSRNEAEATGLAIGVLVFWILATNGMLAKTEYSFRHGAAPHGPLVWVLSPFVFVFSPTDRITIIGTAAQAAVAAGLTLWAIRAIKPGAGGLS